MNQIVNLAPFSSTSCFAEYGFANYSEAMRIVICRKIHSVEVLAIKRGPPMHKLRYIAVLTGLCLYLPTLSHAENRGAWTLKSGLTLINFDESADVFLGGNQVPGASFTTDNDHTITASLDYRYNASWSVEVTIGIPPEATLNGSGPLDGLTLGKVTYGPATLTALYHLPAMSENLDFYLGGGVNYTIIFDTEDGVVTNFEADNTFALTVQAGVIPISLEV